MSKRLLLVATMKLFKSAQYFGVAAQVMFVLNGWITGDAILQMHSISLEKSVTLKTNAIWNHQRVN